MSTATMIQESLANWLDTTEGMLVGENVGRGGGLGGSTQGLQERFGSDRVVDLPIADRGALGFALGVALSGRPVCLELTSTRSLLAAAEVLSDAAHLAQGEFRPALTIRLPVGGEAGPSIDVPIGQLVAGLPGLSVVAATPSTGASLLRQLLGQGVSLLLEPRTGTGQVAEAHPGKLRVLREGHAITIAAWGTAVSSALEAAEIVGTQGISAEVLDLVSLLPLDPALGAHVRKTGRLVVAHPSDVQLAGQVLRTATQDAFLYLESPPSDCHAEPATLTEVVRQSVHY